MTNSYRCQCRCKEAEFEIQGEPILVATCHCESCRTAAQRLAALSPPTLIQNREGGTEYALVRKDRVHWLRGYDQLRAHRLSREAGTQRVITSCCHSPMFLEFKGGHWLSVYRERLGPEAPPVELRTMVKDRPEGPDFGDDIPSYKSHSPSFMWRLFKAWAAMGFRAPKLQPIAEAQ